MSTDKNKLMLKKANESISKIKDKVKNDKYRQRYHFMAPAFWLNDPNGLIQFKGKYHLFYQHNPYAPYWGKMHWGHAISDDLVHWEYLPIALAPSEEYEDHKEGGCFSGSAVDDNGILSLLYTATTNYGEGFIQTQCLAISKDGVNFVKYKDNPVIKEAPEGFSNNFRDPKVWKHKDYWYMVVGTSKDGKGMAVLYKSLDLKKWEYISVLAESWGELGTMWECPDFFSLSNKDVLMFSPMHLGDRKCVYLTGKMDYKLGKLFWNVIGEVDWGFDFYAPQSFVDNKDRRIIIGWANGWDWMPWWGGFGPTDSGNWRGAMSIPRIVEIDSDGKLKFSPIEELSILRYNYNRMEEVLIEEDNRVPIKAGDGISYEIIAEFDLEDCNASAFGLALRCSEKEETIVECNLSTGELIFDRRHSDKYSQGVRRCSLESTTSNSIKLHIFVDTCSVEIFTDGGKTVMSNNIYPSLKSNGIYLYSLNGSVKLKELKTWGLSSIW